MENQKQRHGCLTAWLILMMIANAITAVANLLSAENIQRVFPRFPLWGIWVLALLGASNILFAVALFRWKKWGFYGFGITSVITFIVNIYGGIGVVPSTLGLVSLAILYGVLQIGSENKGWSQLE